ncbi:MULTISPECIES: dipicolinate synthase subunit DpsA [Limnochorda]|uniref:dipicolinate synthase subunit DpsA n=1 Tax=Limnochorda TaxID=1676651 RepID=UPI0018199A0C|nr:dipicolinate synthase subunit DpsA [Limnochorda pilosa]MBO2486630.1 dipicolinic acid synthetase subunit A [Bacillota bacterium]MBO2518304.1 dipicolinic acid synthetase subunit A [Bacillota bacterium]NMA70739.1 dipicolinate synthase subunit DpsA [Bacillota bacterium]
MPELDGVRVTLLGGDRREVELARILYRLGASLTLFGLPRPGELTRARAVADGPSALVGAQVVIAPMRGLDREGRIPTILVPDLPPVAFDQRLVDELKPNTLFLVGQLRPPLRERLEKRGLKVVELAHLDEVAILNSVPTAEGAIQLAMEELPITLHGAQAVVLGAGRCGLTLAQKLAALSASVTVVEPRPERQARAAALGCRAVPPEQMVEVCAAAPVIFNTVPAPVLDRALLERLQPETLIIDIASEPGGTDFEAARRLGLKAILAVGLPGKVAPTSAGRILGQVIPRLIRDHLAGQVAQPAEEVHP